jgi:hypothetical protein
VEERKVGATVLLVIGVAILLYVFYQGYLLFTSVSTMSFEASAQLTIPTPAGDVPLNIPGVGSLPIVMRAIVEVLYLGVLIVVGSKIAGKGVDLLKKA